MPHLTITYTPQLESEADMALLCRTLANTLLGLQDDAGQPVFPTGGTRVLATPAVHSAVADGERDYAFVYLNLRIARGRSSVVQQQVGVALLAVAKAHFEPLFARRALGLTLQVDEGAEVFNASAGSIHPLFKRP